MTRALIVVAAFLLGGQIAAHAQTQTPVAPHQHAAPQAPTPPPPIGEDHAQHQPPPATLPPFIPPLTDADRAAAFPDVDGHTVHDQAVNYFVLFDQLEWQAGKGADAFSWDTKGWVGRDRTRFWFRTEGDRADGRTEQAQTHLLFGRAVARWWDLTAGLRVDTLPSTPRTALALGIQGLAPYWFDVEASAYVEPSGRSHVRVETRYDLLITNRLVFQPQVEFEVYGRSDPERGIDTGLSTGELGLRVRYELRRELAPYVGVVWTRRFFGTADLARDAGDNVAATRLAVGLRTWF
jgi:copper resistance protein B